LSQLRHRLAAVPGTNPFHISSLAPSLRPRPTSVAAAQSFCRHKCTRYRYITRHCRGTCRREQRQIYFASCIGVYSGQVGRYRLSYCVFRCQSDPMIHLGGNPKRVWDHTPGSCRIAGRRQKFNNEQLPCRDGGQSEPKAARIGGVCEARRGYLKRLGAA